MILIRFVLSLFFLVSCLYAGNLDSLNKSYKSNSSEELLFSWTNTSEFAVSGSVRVSFESGLMLKLDLLSMRWIKDDSEYRFSPITTVTSLGMMVFGLSLFQIADTTITKPFCYAVAGLQFLLNPTIEYAILKKHVPVFAGLGYNTDWFVFSRGRRFYFKPHADLGVNLKIWNIGLIFVGSFAYLVTDTYDAKKGPRFEFRLGLGIL